MMFQEFSRLVEAEVGKVSTAYSGAGTTYIQDAISSQVERLVPGTLSDDEFARVSARISALAFVAVQNDLGEIPSPFGGNSDEPVGTD